jgi:hypothetical protein
MDDQNPQGEWKASTRGEAAWQEARDRVASRNDEARKSGRRQREANEQAREDARQAAERRRHALLVNRRRAR